MSAAAALSTSPSPQASQSSSAVSDAETLHDGTARQAGSGRQVQHQGSSRSSSAHLNGMNGRDTQARSQLPEWLTESSSAQGLTLESVPAAVMQDRHTSSTHPRHSSVASSTTPTLLESGSGSKTTYGAGTMEDPEDWWEDEDTEEEDVGGDTLLGADTDDADRRKEAASYKAAVQEYRQSKRALMRSHNASLFASVEGSDADAASSSDAPTEVGDPPTSHAKHQRSRSGSKGLQINGSSSPRRSPVNGLGLLHDDEDVMREQYPEIATEADGLQQRRQAVQSPTPKTETRRLHERRSSKASLLDFNTSSALGLVTGLHTDPHAPPSAASHATSSRMTPVHSAAARGTPRKQSFTNSAGKNDPPLRSAPPPSHSHSHSFEEQIVGPFSLWDYLRDEVLATDFDSTQELKWERVTNFMTIPFWMEKIITFGFVICLDSFLYTFTIMPLRSCVALWTWTMNTLRWLVGGEKRFLSSSHKCDMLKALLVVLACYILSITTDASKMYHSVRGQDLVKLYVIFNVLEIADRLCCSFGQDILDTLFSRTTLARRRDGRQPYLRPLAFFAVSLAYVMAHTLVLLYQMVTLNVAINSYDNALLTLLVSNQFVEIKGSVFKKFEKENLFQLTCADIVERFQLALMLSFIALRNLIELAGAQADGASGPLPTSFTVIPSFNLLETIVAPVCIVLASECLVDWLKHAFITKFNHIRPAVYGRYMDVLCRDLVIAGPGQKSKTYKHTFVDQSPIVARRLGFAALPLACLLVRVFFQIVGMLGDTSHFDECALPEAHRSKVTSQLARRAALSLGAVDESGTVHRVLQFVAQGLAWTLTVVVTWAFLVAIKILLGMNLVSYASKRYATMHEREQEEQLNARNRPPIGVHKEEQEYEARLAQLLDKADDDASRNNAHGKSKQVSADGKPDKGGGQSLLDVSRYTMVKSRIW